jgi:type I restriction enzyme S subunit
MPNLNTSILAALPLLLPPLSLQRAFSSAVRALDERVTVGLEANGVLVELRDTLLPKLMSGELRVRDAEHVVGAAT